MADGTRTLEGTADYTFFYSYYVGIDWSLEYNLALSSLLFAARACDPDSFRQNGSPNYTMHHSYWIQVSLSFSDLHSAFIIRLFRKDE